MSPEEIQRRRDEHFALVSKRKVLIERSVAASHSGDKELAEKLFTEMIDLTPEMCEHGRCWSSNCIACEEIHKEIFPEYYAACNKCANLYDKDELNDKGNCDNCQYELDNP